MAFIATYIVGPLGMINTQLWAVFISWAAFVFAGGGATGLRTTLPALIFGAAVGWAVLHFILASSAGIEPALAAAIAVGVGVAVICAAAVTIPILASIPSAFFGFVAAAAFALLADKTSFLNAALLTGNPFININLPMILGCLFGIMTKKFVGLLIQRKKLISNINFLREQNSHRRKFCKREVVPAI